MRVPFVDLQAQYHSIKEDIDAIINEVIASAAFIGGKYVSRFETNFSAYTDAKFCVGVGNGTDALFIALKSLGIGSGDEVITVANTFIATAEAITLAGAKVVFVDCDDKTYNINASQIEDAITDRTKAIIPVHLYGQPADLDAIGSIARKYSLYVVEDAAQAHGAGYKGKSIGGLSDFTCVSFFPGKNLGAYGDAGAVMTNDADLANKARMLSNHGRMTKYDHEFEGVNSRLDGLQAAILDVKLKYLEEWTERRRSIAKIYDENLKDIFPIPYVSTDVRHVYHLYVIQTEDRETLRRRLEEGGIATGVHYPKALPFLKAYHYLGHQPEDFPVAYGLQDKILSLPIHGSMPDDQVYFVIEQLRLALV